MVLPIQSLVRRLCGAVDIVLAWRQAGATGVSTTAVAVGWLGKLGHPAVEGKEEAACDPTVR